MLSQKDNKIGFIKLVEERENILNEGEKRTIELLLKNLDHKRAFLNNLMSMSVAVIAGLFLLLISNDGEFFSTLLIIIAVLSFALFVIISTIWLTYLFSKESSSLDRSLEFIKTSKQDFIQKLKDGTIKDFETYENYRKEKYKEEKTKIKKEIKGTSEFWFIFIIFLFVFSFIILLIALLLRIVSKL